MTDIRDTAMRFFDACETGQGWEACKAYCHPDAGFASQGRLLAKTHSIEAYAGFMQGLFKPLPDARYELKCVALDEARRSVAVYAVFHGTHTGEGGPVPPTGKATAVDYVYVMEFDGDRIRRMTKIWNDVLSGKQLGWS